MNMTQNNHNAGDVVNQMDLPRLRAQLVLLHERLQALENEKTEQDLRIHKLENELKSLKRRLVGGGT